MSSYATSVGETLLERVMVGFTNNYENRASLCNYYVRRIRCRVDLLVSYGVVTLRRIQS